MAICGLSGHILATVRIVLVVVPAFLLFGYNQSSLGGVLAYPSFTKYFPTIDSTNTTGTVVAVYTLGCLVGALCIAPVGNLIGRRKSLVIAAAIATIGLILQASSYSLGQLVAGRIIAGIGNGAVNSIVPVWQSECTKPNSRGKNVVVIGIFITSGIAAAGWVNYGLSHIKEHGISWRLSLAIPLIFTAMLLIFPMFFPESPRWLIGKGRIQEARLSMLELNGSKDASLESIELEIRAIQDLVTKNSAASKRGFHSFFKHDPERLFYRFCLAIAINFCAQMTGANVISYYGTTIFKQSLHMPASSAALLNAGVLTWKTVAASFAFFASDRIGRKPLFIVACGGMSLSMAGLAGTVWAIDTTSSIGASIAATFFLFLYMAFFPLGFVGANFLYAAEIGPQDLRIHLSSIGTATHWLFNFVIAEITPIAFVTITWRYYIVYAVIAFISVPLVYFLFPETKGLSLENIGHVFSEPAHFWDIPGHVKHIRAASVIHPDVDVKAGNFVVNEFPESSSGQK
ncbi:sugar transporter [Xylariales sp. PMI_506]|nr:sugar transporter [Xylariales sp. PMI_506]